MRKSDLIKWLVDHLSAYGDEELESVEVIIHDQHEYTIDIETKNRQESTFFLEDRFEEVGDE